MLHPYKLPTHLLLGVRKGATSWIWKQLEQHPDIETPFQKEIYFFNKYYNKGLGWYRRQFTWMKKVVIDTTPDYFNEICAERIKTHYPNIKMMVSLRNPIERAYSHYKFAFFIAANKSSFRHMWKKNWNEIKTRGLYDIHLNSFYKRFPKENLLVLFKDDIKEDSQKFVNVLYDYLQVSRIDGKFRQMRWMPGHNPVWKKTEAKGYASRYESYKKYHKQRTLSEEEFKIMSDYYANSIRNLEKIVNRDLSHWLKIENIESYENNN